MSHMKVEVSVDLKNLNEAQALVQFINALHGDSIETTHCAPAPVIEFPIPAGTTIVPTVEKPKRQQKAAKPVEVAQPEPVEEAAQMPPKVEAPEPAQTAQPSSVTLEMLRTEVGALTIADPDKRTAIKAKLVELGASGGVSTLDPEHYEAMYNYVKSLKS